MLKKTRLRKNKCVGPFPKEFIIYPKNLNIELVLNVGDRFKVYKGLQGASEKIFLPCIPIANLL